MRCVASAKRARAIAFTATSGGGKSAFASPWPLRICRVATDGSNPSLKTILFAYAGRQLVYRAAWLKDAGRDFGLAAAQAKLYTGLLSNRVVNAALQIHGGYGFTEEYAISRLYRDQKILEIGEGTNEVQRMVIAKQLGL